MFIILSSISSFSLCLCVITGGYILENIYGFSNKWRNLNPTELVMCRLIL